MPYWKVDYFNQGQNFLAEVTLKQFVTKVYKFLWNPYETHSNHCFIILISLGLPSWSNANKFHVKLYFWYPKVKSSTCLEIWIKKASKMGQFFISWHKIFPQHWKRLQSNQCFFNTIIKHGISLYNNNLFNVCSCHFYQVFTISPNDRLKKLWKKFF